MRKLVPESLYESKTHGGPNRTDFSDYEWLVYLFIVKNLNNKNIDFDEDRLERLFNKKIDFVLKCFKNGDSAKDCAKRMLKDNSFLRSLHRPDIDEALRYKIDEGVTDFFKSMRAHVKQAMENLDNEKIIDNAIKVAFAKQFSERPGLKKTVLNFSLDIKQDIIKQSSEVLKDSAIGILKLFKDENGKIKVVGYKVAGGAKHSVSGA